MARENSEICVGNFDSSICSWYCQVAEEGAKDIAEEGPRARGGLLKRHCWLNPIIIIIIQ